MARALQHGVNAHLTPLEVVCVALVREFDFFTVDDERVFGVLHRAIKAAVHAVVLEHVSQVVCGLGVVDADDLDVGVAVLERSAQSQATDTAETVDT